MVPGFGGFAGDFEYGLDALRNGGVGVTDEFLERVIEALAAEREKLR